MTTQQHIVLNSGGLDSLLVAKLYAPHGAPHLFVDIGQRYVAKEHASAVQSASACGASLHVLRAAPIAKMFEHAPTGIIPYRNAELLLCAAQYGNHIWFGALDAEINSDKSVRFTQLMEALLNECRQDQYWTDNVKHVVRAPLRDNNLTKTQAVTQYLEQSRDVASLLNTVSCYAPTRRHCGQCPSCFKRWVAFINNRIPSNVYEKDPAKWKTPEQWREAFKGYPEQRTQEIRSALRYVGVDV